MKKILLPLVLSFALLTGCATKQVDPVIEDGPPTADTKPIMGSNEQSNANGEGLQTSTPIIVDDGAQANAIQDDHMSPQALLEETDTPLAQRVIYFEYNSAKISEESLQLLQTHGEFISDNGNVHVRLEGHADERGSREYNVALGDRRNQSVRRVLLFQGASTDQINTVSYGEELPAVSGHNEEAWSKNRRVELIYEVK